MVLSGNNLGRLGNIEKLPDAEAVSVFGTRPEIEEIKLRFKNDPESLEYHMHTMAQEFLRNDELENAWLTLLQSI